jgi:hypothetical protein
MRAAYTNTGVDRSAFIQNMAIFVKNNDAANRNGEAA